jgi:2,3-bisphosphoglycerate-independent phosphoglycerate mutase
VQQSYDAGVTDEFMQPVVCLKDFSVRDNDSVIFFNFRPDRAREITRCMVDEDMTDIDRKTGFVPVFFVCTTEYDATMPNVSVAYPRQKLDNIFGAYISKLGLTQLRIAETEKYAHVTFFFNGGVEQVFPGEERVLIPSPKVATYDEQPEMSAYEVAAEAVKRILSGAYDVIILNFANCDMVGHTGVYEAARKAVSAVDECVGKVVEATSKMGGISLITADHGNAEQMLDEKGQPFTAHTTNLVPFYIVGANVELRDGRLADIAPTMLDLMGLEKPKEMDGETLILN